MSVREGSWRGANIFMCLSLLTSASFSYSVYIVIIVIKLFT